MDECLIFVSLFVISYDCIIQDWVLLLFSRSLWLGLYLPNEFMKFPRASIFRGTWRKHLECKDMKVQSPGLEGFVFEDDVTWGRLGLREASKRR